MEEIELDSEAKRHILRQVAAYRDLCESVRKSGTSSLFFGAVMLALWYGVIPDREKYAIFGLIYLSLAAAEFATGLLNRFRPSAEGVLFDGLILIAFGGSNLIRVYLRWEAGGNPFSLLTFFSVYWLYQGVQHVRGYATLRKLFTHRPTAEHLRWFADLLREVKSGNPELDPDALDLPTAPRVKAKLLGDTAVVLIGSEVVISAREQFDIAPMKSTADDDRPRALLAIGGYDFGEFTISPENWQNYTKWKAGK